jgi:hypothetical protein
VRSYDRHPEGELRRPSCGASADRRGGPADPSRAPKRAK